MSLLKNPAIIIILQVHLALFTHASLVQKLPNTSQRQNCQFGIRYSEDVEWTTAANNPSYSYGQATGVDVDQQGNVFFFHRANNPWTPQSFDENNVFRNASQLIQKDATIKVLSATTGQAIGESGKGHFLLPHTIYFDEDDQMWIVDQGLHQIFMFKRWNDTTPSVVWGEANVPGNDTTHFCRPCEVVRHQNWVYIADGYCNKRVVVYDIHGNYVTHFGQDHNLLVAHGIALSVEHDLVCAASRETYRVVCFNAGIKDPKQLGQFRFEVKRPDLEKVTTVKLYDDYIIGGSFLTNIPNLSDQVTKYSGSIWLTKLEHLNTFCTYKATTTPITNPHALMIKDNMKYIYTVDSDAQAPRKVLRFVKESS